MANIEFKNFKLENTSIWSFPERGDWHPHNPEYRGNFAPQVARNIILRYSNEGDMVLDPMVGGGTTLIETCLLNRRGIGYDINPKAVDCTLRNLNKISSYKYQQTVKQGDARNLSDIDSESIDLILTHPPYWNIIEYTSDNTANDLSRISDLQEFCDEFEIIVKEFYRVLKENCYCVVLIGDTRRNQHYVPISYYILHRFLRNNFILKEDIIKMQHNCKSTSYWKKWVNRLNFFLIMHEHLFVFRKPDKKEDISKFKWSSYCR